MIQLCPNCRRTYETDIKELKREDMRVQEQFPNATAIQREQLISGICSEKCWNQFIGFKE
jgi:hypothetical protein